MVLWCGLVGLNARPCCDTSAHGRALRGVVVCLVGLNARHAVISRHMTGPAQHE